LAYPVVWDVITHALQYPLCTIDVLDALCRHPNWSGYIVEYPQLPRRLFRSLNPKPISYWTENDHPLPFLKHLYNHAEPEVHSHSGYGFVQACHANFIQLLHFLCDNWNHCVFSSPLGWAAHEGHEVVVKSLLAHSSFDVNETDTYGQTPLSLAARRGFEGIVKLLLSREDVDVNLGDYVGFTPLSWAAVGGHERVVELLLAQDSVNVDLKDIQERTSLWWAVKGGHEGVVKLLLSRSDPDVELEDRIGESLVSLAAEEW